ncbi:hypothetical protein AAFF_G00025810 [Aldrovandia affinis]|uniref:TNFR-Cys domain-containing protein n=1 Tax=Aldrovandia affinis TaxID=143900 RepID=A0AAD7S4Y3_9TELE|nr:hypothetical protein AAFF_G00025810 [Aldrovandia affinis]
MFQNSKVLYEEVIRQTQAAEVHSTAPKMKHFQFLLPLFSLSVAYLAAQCTAERGGRARNRRNVQECHYGYEDYDGRKCCKCPLGFHVQMQCSKGNQTTCDECEPGTYLDHDNFLDSCELCTSCDSKANLETKYPCTVKQNTVCTCQKGYYCDKGLKEECKACYPCKPCEDGYVIDKECTSTNDTVCKEAEGGGPWWIVLIVIIVIMIPVGVYIFKKQKQKSFSFGKPKKGHTEDLGKEMKDMDEYTPLKGIDLTPHLYDIVNELGLTAITELARGDMCATSIEFADADARNNAKEKCYIILKDWLDFMRPAANVRDAYSSEAVS